MGFFKLMSRVGPRKFSMFSSASAFLISATLTLLAPNFSTAVSTESNPQILRKFNSGVKVIPHDSKIQKGGEDAFLITEDLVGVADGVGGWSQMGVDPGIYSRALCQNVRTIHLTENRERGAPIIKKRLKHIIIEAAEHTIHQGSTTLVLALLDPQSNALYTANFGDSGYMLLRREGTEIKKLFRSKEMQKSFNFPYQIGYKQNGDDPSLSELNKHEIQNGDVIILGTDGCFDNMFDQDILKIVGPKMLEQEKLEKPSEIAEAIAKQAYYYSHTSGRQSPFGEHSSGLYFGGKQDDITVLVAQISIKESVTPNDL